MKKFFCAAIFLAALGGAAPACADVDRPAKFQAPVLITGFGQCIDANLAKIFVHRLGIGYQYGLDISPEAVDWNSCRTVIAVLGCSNGVCCCSLGCDVRSVLTRDGRVSKVVCGISLLDEEDRCRRILDEAKKRRIPVVAMHLGGMQRRLRTSEPFMPFAGEADYVVVRADGNSDGYFTRLCADKNIPLRSMEKGTELKEVIEQMFKS